MWFDQDQSIDRPVISENRWQLKEKNWWRKLRLLKKYRLKWTQNERKIFSSKTINSYYMAVYYKQTWKQRVKTVENSSDTLYHIKISRLYLKIFHGKRAKYESLLQHQGKYEVSETEFKDPKATTLWLFKSIVGHFMV